VNREQPAGTLYDARLERVDAGASLAGFYDSADVSSSFGVNTQFVESGAGLLSGVLQEDCRLDYQGQGAAVLFRDKTLSMFEQLQRSANMNFVACTGNPHLGDEPVAHRGLLDYCGSFPLSWRVDDEMADASLNEGAVPPAGTYNVAFGPADDVPSGDTITALDAPSVGHTWAQCRDGTLFVANQTGTAFGGAGAFGDEANYHMLDYSLFHMNIRNNAILRVRAFLAR
jgi:hypothetical protein